LWDIEDLDLPPQTMTFPHGVKAIAVHEDNLFCGLEEKTGE